MPRFKRITNYQFSLFGFVPPKIKVPISAERIREAKALFAKGDVKGSAAILREVRERLEVFEQRLGNRKSEEVHHG